jgi:hypothetical protein
MTERARLEEQTRRNLEGMELERTGQIDRAVELYERSIMEGFEGDWPYGRLVAYYERQQRWGDAERVLQRGIEVFKASKRRTPEDRRAVLKAFRGRLRLVQNVARGVAP